MENPQQVEDHIPMPSTALLPLSLQYTTIKEFCYPKGISFIPVVGFCCKNKK
jgi:hypothetical protein